MAAPSGAQASTRNSQNTSNAPSPRPPSRSESPAKDAKAEPYSPEPPNWRPLFHSGCDALSRPDYYLPKPEHPENDMNDNHVRVGIPARHAVGNENFSAHGLIHNILPPLLPALSTLFSEVLRRREFLIGTHQLKPHSHRGPPRVTLNDAKLSAYVKDLADPAVPITRLARNLPHGFRGEKMWEMLWLGTNPTTSAIQPPSQAHSNASRVSQGLPPLPSTPPASGSSQPVEVTQSTTPSSVPLDRAMWFIRTVGASDLSNRSRGSTAISPHAFTAEFTATFVSWIRKQIAELTEANLQGSGSAAAIDLVDEASRDLSKTATRWSAKWRYSTLLREALVEECLLDTRTWCGFLAQAFSLASLYQLPLTLSLVQDHLGPISQNDQLTALVLFAACSHMQALQSPRHQSVDAERVRTGLQELLRTFWTLNAESFVSSTLWTRYKDVLHTSLQGSATSRELDTVLLRGEVIPKLFSNSLAPVQSPQDDVTATLNKLDHFTEATDVPSLEAAIGGLSKSWGLANTVMHLADWACTSLRYSSSQWRPLLASRLICACRSRKTGASKARRIKALDTELEGFVLSWLERTSASPERCRQIDFGLVVTLLSELSRAALFSYPKMLSRLSSKASTTNSSGNNGESLAQFAPTDTLQVRLLRSLPVYDLSANLRHQRRLAIYGSRSTESREEAIQRRLLRELNAIYRFLPPGSDAQKRMQFPSCREKMMDALPHLRQASRFVSHRILSRHVLPSALLWLQEAEIVEVEPIAGLFLVLAQCKDWLCIAELIKQLLDRVFNTRMGNGAPPNAAITLNLRLLQLTKWARDANSKELAALDYLSAIDKRSTEIAQRLLNDQTAEHSGKGTGDAKSHSLCNLNEALRRLHNDIDQSTDLEESKEQAFQEYRMRYHRLWQQQSPPSNQDCIELCSLYISSCWKESDGKNADEGGEESMQMGAMLGKQGGSDLARLWRRVSQDPGPEMMTCVTATLQKLGKTLPNAVQTRRIAGFLIGLLLEDIVQPDVFFRSLACFIGSKSAEQNGTSEHLRAGRQIGQQVFSYLSCTQPATETPLTLVESLGAVAVLNKADGSTLVGLCASLAVTQAAEKTLGSQSHQSFESILCLDVGRDYATGYPSEFGDAARQALQGAWINPREALSLLYGQISPSESPSLLQRPALDVEVESVVERMDDWRASATIEELAFVLSELSAVEASQQSRANAKVSKLAQALVPRLFFGPDTSRSHGLRLWELSGKAFRSAVCDCLWKYLADQTQASASVKLNTQGEDALQALSVILSRCETETFPVCGSEALESLFASMQAFFEQAGNAAHPFGPADILSPCQLVRLALHSPSLWSPGVRGRIAGFAASLLRCLARYTLGIDAEEESCFVVLRDTISLLLQRIPPELQQTCSTHLSQYFSDVPREFPTALASGERIASFCRLLPFAPTSRTGAEGFVLTSRLKDAYGYGEYTPMTNNPWRWGEPVDTSVTTGSKLTESGKSTQSSTRAASSPLWGPLTVPSLNNHIAMALDPFDPQRTSAIPADLHQDTIALEQRRGESQSPDAASEDQCWRLFPSEREMALDRSINGFAEAVRTGRRFVAPRLDEMLKSQEANGVQPGDGKGSTALATLVGMPSGPVQTMAAYLEAEKQKRSAAKNNSSASSGRKRKGSTTGDGNEGPKSSRRRGSPQEAGKKVASGSGNGGGNGSGTATAGRARKRSNSNASANSGTSASKKGNRKG